MIVDENSRDHFGRPRDVTTTSAMAASVNPPITRSLWPSRAGSDHPSLDVWFPKPVRGHYATLRFFWRA